jgi:hypothetical protein
MLTDRSLHPLLLLTNMARNYHLRINSMKVFMINMRPNHGTLKKKYQKFSSLSLIMWILIEYATSFSERIALENKLYELGSPFENIRRY